MPKEQCVAGIIRRGRRSGWLAQAVACEALELRRLLSTVYVDLNSAGPTHDGTSWAAAFTDLQPVLTAAVAGTTIDVAQGTYFPTTGTDRTATFQLKSGVELDGGFAGAVNPAAARNVAAYPTILSGDIGVVGNNSDNSYNIVTGNGTDATAVLDGITITAGNANVNSGFDGTGAGMIIIAGSPTVRNCTLNSNTSLGDENTNFSAGAMAILNESSPIVTNCTFSNNSAVNFGGGIAIYLSSAIISNCQFVDNGGPSVGGGGIASLQSTPTLTSCLFEGNTGGAFGGAIYDNASFAILYGCTFSENGASMGGGMYNAYCAPTLNDCTFSNNTGDGIYDFTSSPSLANCMFSGNSGGGMDNEEGSAPTLTNCAFNANVGFFGGMANYGSSPTLENCTFNGNKSSGNGGGVLDDFCSPTFINCIFVGNMAATDGGGIYDESSSLTLANCVFSGNSASADGGGICDYSSSSTLTNCTFSNNTSYVGGGIYSDSRRPSSETLTDCAFAADEASGAGGGMYIYHDMTTTLTNCTFGDNLSLKQAGGIFLFAEGDISPGSSASLTNCVLWGDTVGEIYNFNVDVGSHAEAAVTYSDVQGGYDGMGNINADPLFVNAAGGNLQLQSGSPCIDAGSNSAVALGVTTDLGGNPRIAGGVVDMGAYEFLEVGSPGFRTEGMATFAVGTAGAFTVVTDGYPMASLTETGSLPAGVTFTDNGDGTATIAGMPSAGAGGAYLLAITANNGASTNTTQLFTLGVDQTPAIASANNAIFTQAPSQNFTVTTTGYPAPTLSVVGNLPSGVTFVDNGDGTATLSGTPAAGNGGNYELMLTASNGIAPNTTQPFVLTIAPAGFSVSPGTVFSITGPAGGQQTLSVASGSAMLSSDLFVALPNYILTVGSSASVTLGSIQHVGGIQIASGGTLDITSYAMFINYGSPSADPETTILGYLKSAYTGGKWLGTGLTSSAVRVQVAANAGTNRGVWAIGYIDGDADPQYNAFTNQILIQPSLAADASEDGRVDFEDLLAIAQNVGSITADWVHGDFNYDSKVDFNDLLLLAQNINKTNGNTPLARQLPAESPADSEVKAAIAVNPLFSSVPIMGSSAALQAVTDEVLKRRDQDVM